ncbi:MAG: T9SS type A sorting domain-containing protein [Candidatus Kapaibacterium sp.]
MKQRLLNSVVCAVFGSVVGLAVLVPSSAEAQTVTIGTIPSASFCAGDPISVSFTATGFWQHKNAFTLQLSDDTGSFTSGFTNLGSIKDTLPGTFTINAAIPGNVVSSTLYRFRIMGALPYTTSADNGSDISIGQVPQSGISISQNMAVVGVPSMIEAYWADVSNRFYWNFGSGATPATDTGVGRWGDTVTYATGGVKIVTLQVVGAGGCAKTVSDTLPVFECATPVIPHTALVINSDTDLQCDIVIDTNGDTVMHWLGQNLWVNPGVTVTLRGEGDTVFAESGSTILGNVAGDVFYLKPGASLKVLYGVAMYADGANPGNIVARLSCPSLTFDYTNAPPNSIMPAGVNAPVSPVEITLAPNPTRGSVVVDGLPSNAREISIENVLGERVEELNSSGAPRMSIDLSKYSPGTYYLRFLSGAAAVMRKIVLE